MPGVMRQRPAKRRRRMSATGCAEEDECEEKTHAIVRERVAR